MATFDFYVDIEDSNGNKLGSGPLASVQAWRYTARFDRAGTIDFTMVASDPQASIVQNHRIARAYAHIDGSWVEVGAGRIDKIDTIPGNDGRVNLRVSGLDLLVELTDKSVRSLFVGAGSGATHATALSAIVALAPPGWAFTPAPFPANNYYYASYRGESVLGALVYMAEKTQTHFYRSANRSVIFSSTFEDSGVRAESLQGAAGGNVCAISKLRRTIDTKKLLTRIYPYGAGNGDNRLTLKATTREAPVGYTLNKDENYIERDAAVASLGVIDWPDVNFPEITLIYNTSADRRGVANMLFDEAMRELNWRSDLASQETFDLSISQCNTLLRPLQTIRVAYRDTAQGIDIDQDLYILEATWEMNASGVRTSNLVVSTDDRWPDNEVSAAANAAVKGRAYEVHPQWGPNEYWENGTLYIGSDQTNHVAEFPFVLSARIVVVEQVLFRFKVTQPLSFTSTVAASSTSSGPSSEESSANGSTHNHTVTLLDHTHPVPNHEHSIPIGGSSASTDHVLWVSGGGFGFLEKGSAGSGYFNTDSATGATTASDGGAAVPTSSDEDEHTHDIEHTHVVEPEITTSYGVFRSPAGQTYAIEDLEYRVNNDASWHDLDDADDVGDDYFQLDITEFVQEPDDFGPVQENNLIEIRRKATAGTVALEGVSGDGTQALVSTNPISLTLDEGTQVTISGTTSYNGTFAIIEVLNDIQFYISHTATGIELGGTMTIDRSAMILAKLGVASTIQSVALV